MLPLLAARDSVRFVDSGRYEESATITLPDVPLTNRGMVFAQPEARRLGQQREIIAFRVEEMWIGLEAVNARNSLLSKGPELDGARIEIRSDFNDGHVSISVADNGAGIPEELHERIWEPFFTTKDPDKGTGLGLSICRNRIEQCSGRLELESKPAAGTTLTILLPPHAESDRAPEDPVAIQT